MDMFEELQSIESLLDSARRLPGLGTMVDEKNFKEALQNLQQAVPTEVRTAQQITIECENMVNRAVAESEQIAAAAEQELQSRINDSPVVKAANKRAREILDAAQEQANAMLSEGEREAKMRRDETNQYADEVMRDVDSHLSGLAVSVRKGVALMESEADRPSRGGGKKKKKN